MSITVNPPQMVGLPEMQETKKKIQLRIFSEPCCPELVVNRIASIKGPVDVYFWYEGSINLPVSGAKFMKDEIFEPLYRLKPDAKLCLYSLMAWDFNRGEKIDPTPSVGDAINRINTTALECINSSAFFKYCKDAAKKEGLYAFFYEELRKKDWLNNISKDRKPFDIKVSDFFNNEPSLLDRFENDDVALAYSSMQYVEGYYLIRESVRRGLEKNQKKIEVAFVLANDESKYYRDLPQEIETMLQLDFGNDLAGVEVNIVFQFFRCGKKQKYRTYIDKSPNAQIVAPNQVSSYFDFIPRQPFPQQQQINQ